jgi:hypothetical protein
MAAEIHPLGILFPTLRAEHLFLPSNDHRYFRVRFAERKSSLHKGESFVCRGGERDFGPSTNGPRLNAAAVVEEVTACWNSYLAPWILE